MKRYLLVLLALAGISLQAALAGTCGYHGYSSYSVGYKPSYATYTGYSAYRSGSYYWPGGWYGGDSYYSAGYYGKGYYPSYGYDYNYYEAPTFYRYQVVIPVANLPSYGSHYIEGPPAAPAVATATTTTAVGAAVSPGPAPAAAPCTNGAMADAKLDRILAVVSETSNEVGYLRQRIEVLEKGAGISPPPRAPVTPPATKPVTPPAKEETTKPPAEDAPAIMHTRCAGCHDSKAVARERSKVTLFVTGKDGPEMAGLSAKGEIEPLTPAVLKKIEKVLADSTMPPAKDVAGKPVPAMAPAERSKALAFIREVLAGGGSGK